MSTFGDWLHATARGLGYMRDTDVARALGVSPSTIGRWRRGTTPSVQELVTISRTFDVHLEALLVLAGLVERDEVSRAEPPPPPRPFSPAQRMIENAELEEESKEVLRTYWKSRMSEEHNRLKLLIDMTVGPQEEDSFARYVSRGEVSDPVLRHIDEVTGSGLHAHVLRVLTLALARNFRDSERTLRTSMQVELVRDQRRMERRRQEAERRARDRQEAQATHPREP